MTAPGENVLSGKRHPGTALDVFQVAEGWVLAFPDADGMSLYSIESKPYHRAEDAVADLVRLGSGTIPVDRLSYSQAEDAFGVIDKLTYYGRHPFGQQRLEDV